MSGNEDQYSKRPEPVKNNFGTADVAPDTTFGYLLEDIKPGRQPRLVARSGIFVQNALLDRLVERRDGFAVGLAGGGFIAFFQALTHVAQRGTQLRGVLTVAGGPFLRLTGALQRRKMIGHEPIYL